MENSVLFELNYIVNRITMWPISSDIKSWMIPWKDSNSTPTIQTAAESLTRC